eukprot:Nk52_evm52s1020 gene=Nk52_evmTU52s1020
MSTEVSKEHTVAPVSALPFTIAYLPAIFVLAAIALGPSFYWMPLIIVFVFIPIIDNLVGTDDWNPTKAEEKELATRFSFRLVTYLMVPLQFATMVLSCYAFSVNEMTTVQGIGLVISAGLSAVASINVAHELIHKPLWYEQEMGKFLLVCCAYGHFYLEHLWGHHKNVATPKDPATSRYNETLYAFLPRSVYYSFISAWNIEKGFLAKKGASEWSVQNRIIQMGFQTICLALAMANFFGARGFAMFWGQAIIGFLMLEIINYIEHYGLSRKLRSNGEYAPTSPIHSWNAGERVTNYFLFKLQRHSDHHAYGGRRYQILRSWKVSPQMPAGYATMFLAALCPPLWFWLMNERVVNLMKMYDEIERTGINPFVDPSVELEEIAKVAKAN